MELAKSDTRVAPDPCPSHPSIRIVMSPTEFTRRNLLKSAALGAAGATLNLGAIQRAFAPPT